MPKTWSVIPEIDRALSLVDMDILGKNPTTDPS
jgi:hypothetical protein